MRIGVICGRSWIGRAFIERCGGMEIPKDYVQEDSEDWMELDALLLVAGRVRPDEREKAREIDLIGRVLDDCPYGLRVVYLSSMEAGRNTDYGQHKSRCESLICGSPKSGDWVIVRPPAVYGPSQPLESDMLIPSIARTGGELSLREPDVFREYVHIDDLVRYLNEIIAFGYAAEGLSTIRATPKQLVALFRTWSSYGD